MTRSIPPRRSVHRPLFDPPSLDDLDYLPDPLGRLGMGDYVERPEVADPQGWEDARADWRGGASMTELFGDRALDLQSGVGIGRPNRRSDVFRLQSLLHREGYLDADATEGPTGYWGGRDDDALRRFQKDNGLTVDGWAAPDGESMETLRGFYQPRRRPPVRPVQVAQAAPASTAPARDAVPLLYHEVDRRRSILQDTPGRIHVEPDGPADASDPWYLVNDVGLSAVRLHDEIIRHEARRQGVDPDLVRAIIYAENARGHYFSAARLMESLGQANSIFPMNINPELWRDLGFAGRDPGDPAVNIRAGVTLLKRIRDRLDDPVPEAIGTLYNGLAKDKVTEYGAYIGRLMQEKPWQKN